MVISSSKMVVHWNISRSISMGIKARNMVFFGSFSGTHDIYYGASAGKWFFNGISAVWLFSSWDLQSQETSGD